MDIRECYKILEVSENISDDDLKAHYKTLSKIYHPDKNPGDADTTAFATEKLKKINNAYTEIKKYRKSSFYRKNQSRKSSAPYENGSNDSSPPTQGPTAAHKPDISKAVIWVVLAAIYFLLPDFIPGPIDDIAVNLYALYNLYRIMNTR